LFGTYAPFRNSFIEMGIDAGFGAQRDNLDHFSLYPHIRYNFYFPRKENYGWLLGAGIGYMYANYSIPDVGETSDGFFIIDLSTGILIKSFIFTYTIQTDFFQTGLNSKLAVGYLYRFKGRGE